MLIIKINRFCVLSVGGQYNSIGVNMLGGFNYNKLPVINNGDVNGKKEQGTSY